MKYNTLISIFVILTSVFLTTSCGSSSSDPVKVAEQFVTAYMNGDYDRCNELMVEDGFTPSKNMSSMEKAMVEHMKAEAKQKDYVITLDEDRSSLSTDPCVYFCITSRNDPKLKDYFVVDLEQEDENGKWLVYKYDLK